MSELTVKQTTEYLKQIAELETSVYKQTEVRKKAKNDLKMPDVKKATVTKPQEINIVRPIPETIIDVFKGLFINPDNVTIAIVVTGVGALRGLFIAFGLPKGDEVRESFSSIALIVLCIALGLLSLKTVLYYLAKKEEYTQNLSDYKVKFEQLQAKYQQDMRVYAENEKIATKEFESAKQKAEKSFNYASNEVAKLDKPLEETQAILNKLYDADIIFPKYRNMVAMCTIYEYFASGRCTELTGATGAYNLYESELRQNLIINQLEEVNANLEQVRQNQYILYQGISETNKVLREVSADIGGILSMTRDIAVSSRITAFCSQVTAVNSVAQTYIETREYLSDH